MPPTDDAAAEREFVRRARDGDQEAFDRLVLAHQARLRAYVARFVANGQDVYDIVQDAFLDAYRGLGNVDPERPFGPWIRAVCRNHMYDFMRRRCREAARGREAQAALLVLAERDAASDADEGADERLAALRCCLGELGDRQRDMLSQRYVQQVPLKDVAVRINKSAAAAAMLLMRLRAKLQECVRRQVGRAEA